MRPARGNRTGASKVYICSRSIAIDGNRRQCGHASSRTSRVSREKLFALMQMAIMRPTACVEHVRIEVSADATRAKALFAERRRMTTGSGSKPSPAPVALFPVHCVGSARSDILERWGASVEDERGVMYTALRKLMTTTTAQGTELHSVIMAFQSIPSTSRVLLSQ
jgi:hypothetical protein